MRWPLGAVQDKLLAMDPREITYEMVARKLGEIVLSRGKKGVDRQDQVDMLAYLATVARGPAQKVRMCRRSAAAADIIPSPACWHAHCPHSGRKWPALPRAWGRRA